MESEEERRRSSAVAAAAAASAAGAAALAAEAVEDVLCFGWGAGEDILEVKGGLEKR